MSNIWRVLSNPQFWRALATIAKVGARNVKGTWNAFGSGRDSD